MHKRYSQMVVVGGWFSWHGVVRVWVLRFKEPPIFDFSKF